MHTHTPFLFYALTTNRGEMAVLQKGPVSAAAWMDSKVVTVMSSCTQPQEVGEVQRQQKDGTRASVPSHRR